MFEGLIMPKLTDIDPGTGLTLEELFWAFMSPRNAKEMIKSLEKGRNANERIGQERENA